MVLTVMAMGLGVNSMVNGFDDFLINLHNPQLFRRIVNRVMALEYGDEYVCPDDDQGDQGNDGYVKSKHRLHAVHCFKKDSYVERSILKKARSDLKKAGVLRDGGLEIKEWSFVTSYRPSTALLNEINGDAEKMQLKFVHQGPDQLAALVAKHADHMQDIPEVALAVKVRDARFETGKEPVKSYEGDRELVKVPPAKDDLDLRRIMQIMRSGGASIRKNIEEIRQIYYTGRTHHARLQAGFLLLDGQGWVETTFEDKIALIDSLLSLARLTGDSSAVSILYAERGQTFSHHFALSDLRSSGRIQIHSTLGLEAYTEDELKNVMDNLHRLQDTFKEDFNHAIEIAYENDWDTLGNVAMRIGNAAGGRYIHFHGLGIEERAKDEKYICLRMYDLAQNAFIATGDRSSQLMAQHNLANQLRNMGELKKAEVIIAAVVREAEKQNYVLVLDKARQLLELIQS
jgi:hypothetical protein